jgi:hypothetical protein
VGVGQGFYFLLGKKGCFLRPHFSSHQLQQAMAAKKSTTAPGMAAPSVIQDEEEDENMPDLVAKVNFKMPSKLAKQEKEPGELVPCGQARVYLPHAAHDDCPGHHALISWERGATASENDEKAAKDKEELALMMKALNDWDVYETKQLEAVRIRAVEQQRIAADREAKIAADREAKIAADRAASVARRAEERARPTTGGIKMTCGCAHRASCKNQFLGPDSDEEDEPEAELETEDEAEVDQDD